MKGGSGDKFFTIDHLLMVSHAYIPNFRALALLLLVEKQKAAQRSPREPRKQWPLSFQLSVSLSLRVRESADARANNLFVALKLKKLEIGPFHPKL